MTSLLNGSTHPPSTITAPPDAAALDADDPAVLRARLERLTGTVQATETERDQAVQALADFKQRVARVGDRAAREHDWCSVFDGILDNLGLTRPPHKVTGDLTIRLRVTGEPDDYNEAVNALSGYLRNSVQHSALEGLDDDLLDSDWSDVSVEVIGVEVDHIEATED